MLYRIIYILNFVSIHCNHSKTCRKKVGENMAGTLTSSQTHTPYPIGCIIMSSGHAARFGSNKLLTSFHGKNIIEYILDSTEGLFAERLVVTRYTKIAQLCAARSIKYILHEKPYLNDTIRLGVSYLSGKNLDGYLFAASDQPLLTRQSIVNLCNTFMQDTYHIHRLAYGQSGSSPVIFPWSLATELMQLPQDKGGNVIIKKYPELVRLVQVQDKYELFDIDTVRDLQQCVRLAEGH